MMPGRRHLANAESSPDLCFEFAEPYGRFATFLPIPATLHADVPAAIAGVELTVWRKPWDSTRNKSLFASFASEKQDSCLFSQEKSAKGLVLPRCGAMLVTRKRVGFRRRICACYKVCISLLVDSRSLLLTLMRAFNEDTAVRADA
jgi:hypothetical protein